MILVADCSALIALSVCESLSLLEQLFDVVVVPETVYHEATCPDKNEAQKLIGIGGRISQPSKRDCTKVESNVKTERITIDPEICHGKPCIRGLRYPVENILEWLSSGMTIDDILIDYEDLEREDVLAVLEFAARCVKVKRIELLAA
jgi:uncharacterized protein (DUF433 family)